MSKYLTWNTKTITDFSDQTINTLYNEGYVFTRKNKGDMYQTRSLRINLENFTLTSENRRILKKTESVSLESHPLPYPNYHWSIGKLAKDFYTTKFGDGTFSANKIKELLTDLTKSNFNRLFVYTCHPEEASQLTKDPSTLKIQGILQSPPRLLQNDNVGYCTTLETNELIHYSYPFYNLIANSKYQIPNLGLGMMLKAILYAKEQNKKYIYLGSAQRPTDTYKLQFEGLEWFDGIEWEIDLEKLKNILNSLKEVN